MKTKKLAVLGRGTAGALSMIQILNYAKSKGNIELEWYFDSNTKTQAVGEGTTVAIPIVLFDSIGFGHRDLFKIDGTFKSGLRKINWKNNNDFFHDFPAPSVGYHINALKLQDYIFQKIKNEVNIVDTNIFSDQIDADYVIDCSGTPKNFDLFEHPKFIPVNAAYVTQCYWDVPRFQYTLTIARPYGWVFGVPLQNRCSIGYLFNDTINNTEEIKEDVKAVFEQFNLTPSDTTNELHFKNYFRKTNFTEKIAYNGNASFFLEPLEATTLTGVILNNSYATQIIDNPITIQKYNKYYLMRQKEIERIIMFHYFAGSVFKSDFWTFAEERGHKCMKEALTDKDWILKYELSKKVKYNKPFGLDSELTRSGYKGIGFEDWPLWSYNLNLGDSALNIYDKIDSLKK